MKPIMLFVCLLFIGYRPFAQTKATIEKMEKAEQSCLDSGVNMLGCSAVYFEQMDSMLNLVYKKLRTGYDSSQRIALRAEERKWILERDAYFKKAANESDGLSGEDRQMDMLNKDAQFIHDRVLELIKRLN